MFSSIFPGQDNLGEHALPVPVEYANRSKQARFVGRSKFSLAEGAVCQAWNYLLLAAEVSLGAQSFDGIDRSSAARRNEAGKQANNSQQCGDAYQRRWIPRL
jgi:hypothetical protein